MSEERKELYVLIGEWVREVLPWDEDPEFGGDVGDIIVDRIYASNWLADRLVLAEQRGYAKAIQDYHTGYAKAIQDYQTGRIYS